MATIPTNRKRKADDESAIWDGEGGPIAFQEAMERINKVFIKSFCDQAIRGKAQPETPLIIAGKIVLLRQPCKD